MNRITRLVLHSVLLSGVVRAQTGSAPAKPIRTERSRAEVMAMIENAGRTRPAWWGSVPLDYPKTLDMTWTPPPRGSAWNPRKNIGQYLWSVINENPGRWKQGAKFMHHVAEVNKSRPDVRRQAWNSLGHIHADLLQDHARGAYWWRKGESRNMVGLADCYWRLGNKEMGVEALRSVSFDGNRYGAAIRLWGDMGEPRRALSLAEKTARAGNPAAAYLSAGNVCRVYDKYDLAVEYYEKVLAVPKQGNRDWKFQKDLAKAAIEAIRVFETLDIAQVADGTHVGTSMSFAGPLTVSVKVAAGRIVSVRVTKHKDKQYYSAIAETTGKIVEQQSLRGIDATTGATVTSDAIVNATARALSKAR